MQELPYLRYLDRLWEPNLNDTTTRIVAMITTKPMKTRSPILFSFLFKGTDKT